MMNGWKRWLIAGMVIVALLLVFFLFWRQMEDRTLAGSLKGTYVAGEQVSGSARYLTFLEDKRYFWYRQGELLEQGSFAMREPGIFTLTAESGAVIEVLALGNGTVYRTEDGVISAYVQLTSTPTFVGLPSALTSWP